MSSLSTTTLYEKVGKKYVPARARVETFTLSFPQGTHMVVVDQNMGAFHYNVDPTLVPSLAALQLFSNIFIDSLVEHSVILDTSTPEDEELLTELRNLFVRYNRPGVISYDSKAAAIRAASADFAKVVQAKLDNPALKQAYDDFMTLYHLTHSEK